MKLGFTGTRLGTTDPQMAAVSRLVEELQPREVHQGCCVGADEEFASLAAEVGAYLEGWPCDLEKFVSPSACKLCDEIHQPQDPLVRNRCIVDEADALIACPATAREERKGGMWYTVRYCRRQGKRLWIVWPDGTVTEENRP